VKLIPLTQGQFAIVDDTDFELLNRRKWTLLTTKSGKYYAHRKQRMGKDSQCILMHRFILDAPQNKVVDHIDNNGLNNQRNNIRIATHQQNLMNQKKSVPHSSRYKGVSLYKANGRWTAQLSLNNKTHHLGYFKTEIEAARAYDVKARECFGEFANTNTKRVF